MGVRQSVADTVRVCLKVWIVDGWADPKGWEWGPSETRWLCQRLWAPAVGQSDPSFWARTENRWAMGWCEDWQTVAQGPDLARLLVL